MSNSTPRSPSAPLQELNQTAAGARQDPFDTAAVLTAARTFTGEINLDELLKNLTTILLEHAGAETGYLLTGSDRRWLVRVKATGRKAHILAKNQTAHDLGDQLPATIVTSVIRSRQPVVLDDATQQGLFVSDHYVRTHRPKSVLCVPILHQQEMLCIIYLENRQVAGAFPRNHLEVISLIASFATIAIKNAQLYEKLEATAESLDQEVMRRKQTQMQLLHAGKLSALGRLSASVAHEFGNPLIGIKYLLNDLRNRPELGAEDKHLIGVGIDECERMHTLIDDLHNLHSPTSGTKHQCNLNEIVQSALVFQRKIMRDIDVVVLTEYCTTPPVIWAVEDQITQVVVNLTMNSSDAMQDSGGYLHVKTRHHGDRVELYIADTGCGIAPEHHEQIFEPFFSTKQVADGSGLGLPIAYSIIKNHHGSIHLTTSPGEGTTFVVSLPSYPSTSIAGGHSIG